MLANANCAGLVLPNPDSSPCDMSINYQHCLSLDEDAPSRVRQRNRQALASSTFLNFHPQRVLKINRDSNDSSVVTPQAGLKSANA
jgi:hypothetical protein